MIRSGMTVLFYSDMMILDSIHDLLSLTQLLGPNFPFPIYVPHRETQARGENAELTKGAEESELKTLYGPHRKSLETLDMLSKVLGIDQAKADV